MLTTEATIKSIAPLAGSCGDVVVDVTIDELGRMVDYKVVNGFMTSEQLRRLENRLIFTTFEPVVSFLTVTRAGFNVSEASSARSTTFAGTFFLTIAATT